MTPEKKLALLNKMSEIVQNLSEHEIGYISGELFIWITLKYPEKLKEFFDVNEDLRKQFKIEGL